MGWSEAPGCIKRIKDNNLDENLELPGEDLDTLSKWLSPKECGRFVQPMTRPGASRSSLKSQYLRAGHEKLGAGYRDLGWVEGGSEGGAGETDRKSPC